MANLTLSIDDSILRRARIRALEQGTSVNAVVRSFLESYAGIEERVAAIESLIERSEGSDAGTRGGARTWRRDEIYAGRIG